MVILFAARIADVEVNEDEEDVKSEADMLESSSFRGLALIMTRRPSDGTYWAKVIAKVMSSHVVWELIRRGNACGERSDVDR